MKSPYDKMYKQRWFRWLIYNSDWPVEKKEFIDLPLWKQHLLAIICLILYCGVVGVLFRIGFEKFIN
ncbi:MAG: hypothetical protein VYE38_06200 [Bacteroidota bacterium]|nr:hypothetical protein [Bacteroidota bacterium]